MQKIATLFILLGLLIACENRIKDETIIYPEFNSKQFNQDVVSLQDSEDGLEEVGIRFVLGTDGIEIDDNFKTASGKQDNDVLVNAVQSYEDDVDAFLYSYDQAFSFKDIDEKTGVRSLHQDFLTNLKEKHEIAKAILEESLK